MNVMQREYELIKNRFIFGMQQQEILSGKKPRICMMGEIDYVAMEFLAREECTIYDDKIETGGGTWNIRYYGVELYQSVGLTDMVFGT